MYDARVFFELNNPNRVVAYTYFDFTGTADVEVHVPCPVTSVRVRPTARGIQPRVEGQRITFTLTEPAKLSVEVNGGIDDNLHLFAGRPETGVPFPDKRIATIKVEDSATS